MHRFTDRCWPPWADLNRIPRDSEAVVSAPVGDLRSPPPGRHAGPVVVRKPITLVGDGQAVIDAGGSGSVIRLLTGGGSPGTSVAAPAR